MKTFKKIFILLLAAIILTACSKKEPLKSEEAISILSSNGFIVTDVTNQMEDDRINYVGSANNGKFQIEYYIFSQEADAKKAYESNKESFENNKTKGKEKKDETYQKYTQELSDTYNVLTRVGNTLLYSSVNIEYKKDLNKVIKAMGY